MQDQRSQGPGDVRQQWVLRRNCALTPRQLGACFGGLGLVSIGIATAFAVRGAWPVVPFAFVEVAALVIAFIVYSRHAADYERIVLATDRVLIETVSADSVSRRELHRARLRVEYEEGRADLVRLVCDAETLPVGRFVPWERRGDLARELRSSLAGMR